MDNPALAPISKCMDFDVIIAGGGLNGCALALALKSAGISVALADPQPVDTRADPAFDGRSYALALTSKRLLEALGLWDNLADVAQPMLDIKISDGRAGEGPSPFVLEFDHAEIEEGPMGFMVEDRHLRHVLLDGLDLAGVTHLHGEQVTNHQASPGDVVVQVGHKSILARVLVGADGMRSPTAQRARIKRIGWDYDQSALVTAISHEKSHDGIAHQFFMPSGPLAVLPLTGNRSSIVWTEDKREAERIQALNDAGYLDELRPRFGDFLGDIMLDGVRFTYPLLLSLAEKFVASRVALLGDAAHRVHPIAGQGLNAGLKDVAALAEVLTQAARRGEDIGAPDVLDRYEQWRRFDVATLAAATDGFNRLFSNDNPLLRFGRDIGLGMVNSMPGLRRSFIREAAGLTGDLPRLLQGKTL